MPLVSKKRVFSCTKIEEKVVINDKLLEQIVTIRKQLPEHFKERLWDLLRSKADVFTWTHADMMGIPRTIMIKGNPFKTKHKLNEYNHIKPIKQKRRGLGLDRNTTYCKEVEELTKAGILQKNTRATYQRLVDKFFHDQIRRNLEAYVDDMVIKSTSEEDTLTDIKETLERPSKVKAIIDVEQPKTLKDIQSLNGKLAVLSHFLSKGEHDIMFQERGDDKKETPKDFLIKAALEDSRKEAKGKMDTKSENTKLSCEWKLYIDGAASSDGSGAGLMLIAPKGKEYAYALRFEFETKNNKAEYKGLLAGLHIAQDMEIVCLAIFIDSQLLVNQIKEVLVKVLSKRSIEEKEILQVETKEKESWMTPIHEYLVSGLLPEDLREARKIRVKAPQYKLIRGSLYRRILLAVDAQRCRKGNLRLREMQGAIWDKESSGKRRNNSWIWMAVQSLGSQHPRTFANSSRRLKILGNSRRTLHKMGRSKASNNYKRKTCRKICMGIRSVQIWSTMNNQLKGRKTFPRRTLPKNSQKETPFSLTYGFEAIIPIAENVVAKDDRRTTKEVTKRKESKEVASIEEAHYQNKLRRYNNERSNHSTYKIGDFVLLSQNDAGNPQVW
ncbi:reverse transcriptase domain-containing protein [Tanacetum coccineum]